MASGMLVEVGRPSFGCAGGWPVQTLSASVLARLVRAELQTYDLSQLGLDKKQQAAVGKAHKAYQDQIMAVLTPAQSKKMKKLMAGNEECGAKAKCGTSKKKPACNKSAKDT